MNSTTYRCIWCGKDTTLCFADDYKPFQRWLMSCLKCGKYGLHNIETEMVTNGRVRYARYRLVK